MAFVLGKAFKTHEAIMLLCEKGYGEDGFMLARTLFELMVMTSYILLDSTDGKLFRYMEYDWVIRKEMFNYVTSKDDLLAELNKRIDDSASEPNVLNEVEEEYRKAMTKHNYKLNGGWSDKSISGMARDIGREGAYSTIYRLQCTVSHTNVRSMNEYVKCIENEGFVINIGPNLDLIQTTLVIAFDFFRAILEEADKQFAWNLQEELNPLYKQYVQVVSKK